MDIEVFFEQGEGYDEYDSYLAVKVDFDSQIEQIKKIILDAIIHGFPVQVGHGIDVYLDDDSEDILILKVVEIRHDRDRIEFHLEEWT